MNIRYCIFREMALRPLGWILGVIALATASGCIIGSMAMLHKHDRQSAQLIAELQQRAEERMNELNREARTFSKNLGFNTLLLPKEQDLGKFWKNNQSDVFLSSTLADQLAKANLATLNHLFPILRHRHDWDLINGPVDIVGIEGEIYIKNPAKQKVLQQGIVSNQLILGYGLAAQLKKKTGDHVQLFKRDFTISKVMENKGNADD